MFLWFVLDATSLALVAFIFDVGFKTGMLPRGQSVQTAFRGSSTRQSTWCHSGLKGLQLSGCHCPLCAILIFSSPYSSSKRHDAGIVPNFHQGEIKGQTKRDKCARFAVFRWFSQIFADFRFSWELQHFGGADFRRKPPETADFRRKPQETADFRRNPFVPFSLSLLVPPYFRNPPTTGIFSKALPVQMGGVLRYK